MARKAAKTQRLGPHDWLAGALETLGREGVVGVNVENVARSIGVTKGSFYHHFEDKEEFISRLLEYWETELTDKIDAHLSHLHGKPAEQLLALLEFIAENETNRYDASMHAWAPHDERVATVIRRVDQKRLAYVRNLFLRMGFPAEQAEIRSRMSYYYVVGEHTALAEERTLESRLEDIKLRHELLTGWRAAPKKPRRAAPKARAARGQVNREAIRNTLMTFARDVSAAEGKSETIAVLGKLDNYINTIIRATAGYTPPPPPPPKI